MAVTVEDIKEVSDTVDLINDQIKQLEATRDAGIVRIAVLENERALFGVDDDRDVEALRAEMLALADETVTKSSREKKLTAWVQTLDPAFGFRGWGIDNDRNELFPDFSVEVPAEITDDFVRNVNLFARIVAPVQPARLRVINESFMMGYDGTYIKFDGDKLENSFTVCGTSRLGTSPTRPLLATLKTVSERAFSSWNTSSN